VSGQQAGRGPAGTMPGQAVISEARQPDSLAVVVPQPATGKVPRLVTDAAGFDLRPDPLEADTPAGFTAALREYRIWAGRPSFRELARRTGGTPAASTICTMLRSEELPAFDCMVAFVSACGATEEDCQRFATAWRRISLGLHIEGPRTQQIPAPRDTAERLPDRQDR
jgi:hypothetical protein